MTAFLGLCPQVETKLEPRPQLFARMGHLRSDAVTAQTTASVPLLHMEMAKQIPDLPPGARLVYLAEGGANVVYKIIPPGQHDPDDDKMASAIASPGNPTTTTTRGRESNQYNFFAGKLLRLRKLIDSGTPYQETMRNFDSMVRPLFRDDELVDQMLIRLPRGFVAQCNDQLRADEACNRRPKSRHGVYLSSKEPFGLLITDMTPNAKTGACLWEFKPKWLLQSPSAPSDAKRCRTCALREMKNHDARIAGESETHSFCPLDLVSDNYEDVVRAAQFIKGSHGFTRVARFLHRNSTLLKLQDYQRQMNAVGLPGLHAQSRERAVSMTLRDCTVFVKVKYPMPYISSNKSQ